MIKICHFLLVLCIFILSINTLDQNLITSRNFICDGNVKVIAFTYISSVSVYYSISIYENLKANTNIRVQFDSEGTIVINFSSKNVSRFTSDPDLINNVFNLEILEDVKSFGFKVVGKLPPEHPPYLISLKINGEEKCAKPTRIVFNSINGTSMIENYWPAAPDKFCGRRKVYKKHTELIVSGSISKPGYWPWHVALYGRQHNSLKYRCGGTLLSKLLVLTAAHCVAKNGAPINPQSIGVVLGKFRLLNIELTTQDIEIFRIIVHDEFDHTKLNNDIALLQLNSEAHFNNYVQPACLWFDDIYDQLHSFEVKGTVAGWGFDHAESTTNELREITIPVVPELLCIRFDAVFYSNILNEKKFCAGYTNGTAACNGDSGGGFVVFVPDAKTSSYPLEKRPGAWYVKGIVSATLAKESSSLCDPKAYTVFTDVAKYRDWILKYLS